MCITLPLTTLINSATHLIPCCCRVGRDMASSLTEYNSVSGQEPNPQLICTSTPLGSELTNCHSFLLGGFIQSRILLGYYQNDNC